MNRRIVLLILAGLALVVLAGCAKPAPTATGPHPTATTVPPTKLPVLPTETPIPPTETPVPPTVTSIPSTATLVPTNTSVPTPTPSLYTKDAGDYALPPEELGDDCWLRIDLDDLSKENDTVRMPPLGLQSAHWHRIIDDGAGLSIGQQVGVYETEKMATAAFMNASTRLLHPYFRDPKEIDVVFGNVAVGYLGSFDSEAEYISLVQYRNVLVRLQLTAKSLPGVVITRYQQLVEDRILDTGP